MPKQLPPRQQQIVQSHASLIVLVVQATQNQAAFAELKTVLRATEKNGWIDLAKSIRQILSGERSATTLLSGLDEEDSTIIESILRGLQDPTSLPDPNAKADPTMAAPGIAHMVQRASQGDAQSTIMLGNMADQMRQAGGDMARLGGIIKRLIDGERNPDILCKGMGNQGELLVNSILDELGRLNLH